MYTLLIIIIILTLNMGLIILHFIMTITVLFYADIVLELIINIHFLNIILLELVYTTPKLAEN